MSTFIIFLAAFLRRRIQSWSDLFDYLIIIVPILLVIFLVGSLGYSFIKNTDKHLAFIVSIIGVTIAQVVTVFVAPFLKRMLHISVGNYKK